MAAKFTPGFRVSTADVVVLVVGLVLAHFFLVCNLFRVSRSVERLHGMLGAGERIDLLFDSHQRRRREGYP